MNKKLVALLIPLMLLPIAGFAYAHWTTTVTKTYTLKAGVVKMDVVRAEALEWPKFSTERKLEVGDQTGPPYVTPITISTNNMQPCDHVTVLVLIHVTGTCPITLSVVGPDPTPPNGLKYTCEIYIDNGDKEFDPEVDTPYKAGTALDPCTLIWVWEDFHLLQEGTEGLMGANWEFVVDIIGTQADP